MPGIFSRGFTSPVVIIIIFGEGVFFFRGEGGGLRVRPKRSIAPGQAPEAQRPRAPAPRFPRLFRSGRHLERPKPSPPQSCIPPKRFTWGAGQLDMVKCFQDRF